MTTSANCAHRRLGHAQRAQTHALSAVVAHNTLAHLPILSQQADDLAAEILHR